MLPWQISDITEVTSPLQFFVLVYYFDNVNEIIKAFCNPSNMPLSIIQTLKKIPVLYLEGEALESMSRLFLQIRNEIGVESIPTQAAAEDFASQELSNLYVTNKLVEIIISFLHAKHPYRIRPPGKCRSQRDFPVFVHTFKSKNNPGCSVKDFLHE